MNKILYHLAIRNLKDHKQRTIYLFLIITFISTVIISLTAYTRLVSHQELLNNINTYGSYYFAVDNVEENQKKALYENPFITEYSMTYQYGKSSNLNIGYLNSNISLLPLSLKSGNLPVATNDIAIEEAFLIQLGYSLELGQKIHLDYILNNGTTVEETFVLSGILNNYSNNMLTSSLQIITAKKDYPILTNFYYITESKVAAIQSSNTIRNEFVFPRLVNEAYAKHLSLQAMVLSVILFGSLLIMNAFNTILNGMTKKTVLLRSIGATRKQVLALMILQSLILTLIAVPISLSLSWIFIYWISNQFNYNFYFDLETCWVSLSSIIAMVMLGSSYPAIKSANVSLVTNLYTSKNRIKVTHKHYFTPIHLALRHMRVYKAKNILLIFVIGCLLLYWANNINSYIHDSLGTMSYNNENIVDFQIQSFGVNIDSNYISEVNKLRGIENVFFEEEYGISIDTDLPDVYYKKSSVKLHIVVLHNLADEKLSSLNIDVNAYKNGDAAFLYLPVMYREEGNNAVMLIEKENSTKVQDTNIQVGQVFSFKNKEFSIGKIIISKQDINSLTPVTTDPYTLYVSPMFMEGLGLQPARQVLSIKISDNIDINGFYSQLSLINTRYSGKREIANFIQDSETKIQNIKNGKIENVLYGLIALLAFVLVMMQQSSIRVGSQQREIGIYHALGMVKNKILRIFLYESLIIGVCSTLFALTIVILADYNKYYSMHINYDLSKSFNNGIGYIVLLISIITNFIFIWIYYYPAKKLINQGIIENIRHSE